MLITDNDYAGSGCGSGSDYPLFLYSLIQGGTIHKIFFILLPTHTLYIVTEFVVKEMH